MRAFPDHSTAALAMVLMASLFPIHGAAQDHPQEVLDLIAAHDALAMKIRVLQDRVAAGSPDDGNAGFRPEGAPVRAATEAAGNAGGEKRLTETLRHKDRAAVSGIDVARIRTRLSAVYRDAVAERNRISAPGFGDPAYRLDRASSSIAFGDGQHGRRLPAGTGPSDGPRADTSAIRGQEIAEAQRALADIERKVRELEKEVDDSEKQD